MKLDIGRAWKDEAYRQTLSEEQRNTLPANPAGEISDTELADVNGGDGHNNGFGLSSSASAVNNSEHRHTFSGLCDINLFSLEKLHVLEIGNLFSTAKSTQQTCLAWD